MKTAKEYVDEINALNFNSPNYVEDHIDMEGVKEVAELNLDEHCWYIIGTKVFKIGDEFFGVRGPISLKSEKMSFDDVGWTCNAFEMVAVPSITYVQK